MNTSALQLLDNNIRQKYQYLAKIGSGGMGDVFLGIQRGAVDFSRLVVIKRIPDHLEHYTEEHAKMFINEASLVASLNHPHIVKIYDFCMTGPTICIVMEYIEGETLKYIYSSCQRESRRIPLEMTCRLILDACDTLHYAHNSTSPTGESHQIVHRDIGLHNLMLDSNGYLKIIDFGIAKSSMQSEMTTPGLIKGNPGYMAPDLFLHDQPDHRIDIYGLGLCLYELLTQSRAYKFEKNATFRQIIQEITTRELPLPSEIVPNLPDGMDEVVFKAIDRDRNQRYQTVKAFASDLKRVAGQRLMTGGDIKEWFLESFRDRLKKRREFGAQVLAFAKKASESQDFSVTFTSQMPSKLLNMNSITPTPTVGSGQPNTTASQEILIRSNYYRSIAVASLLFVGCAVVFYLLFIREPSSPEDQQNESIVTDNLTVTCDPPDSKLSIDGKELGLVGEGGLVLHVEPNKKHEIILSKKGYRNYTLPFIGPTTGAKRIDATLIKLEASLSDSEADNSAKPESLKLVSSGGRPIKSADDEDTTKKRSRSRRRSTTDEKDDAIDPAEKKREKPTIPLGGGAGRKIPLPDDDEDRKIPIVDDDISGI
jgi:eukaryotic-like serine/threonine-protein kinase